MRKAPKTAFKPGQPRPANAGRKKGTPNKRTTEIQEILDRQNFVPGEELIAIYRKQMDIYNKRMEIYAEKSKNKRHGYDLTQSGALDALNAAAMTLNNICQYVYPKKRAIEHTAETGNLKTFADFITAGLKTKDEK